MQGELLVADIMEASHRQQVWRDRQARNAEWYALKQWWAARDAVRRAKTRRQRQRAQLSVQKTEHLYWVELHRAWPKWDMVQAQLGRTWIND
jgi:hypothetical protein